MKSERHMAFWREALAWQGSITPLVLPGVFLWGLIALGVCLAAWQAEQQFDIVIGLAVAPYEIAGAALGLLLVLRTNAGYDRWWEARKLWGGIVNHSRNLAISALAYGPAERDWRERFVRRVATFPHVARAFLRGDKPGAEIDRLLGAEEVERLARVDHMPSYTARRLADLLREACEQRGMDRFAFLQIDRERALLMDEIGACERILKTPLPRVYAIKIRRFIVMFLATLPLALLHKLNGGWLIPLITMLVAYPLMSLDQIGIELQNPFTLGNISHLPLNDIAATIERNVLALLKEDEATS